MTLRLFTEFGAKAKHTLTLRVNNTLFISNSILKRTGSISRAERVEFYIDDVDRIVSLQFYSATRPDKIPHSRKVSNEPSGVSVNLLPILRYFKIPKLKKLVDIECKFDDDNNIYFRLPKGE